MLLPRAIDTDAWGTGFKAWCWFCWAVPTPLVFIRFYVQFHILQKRGVGNYFREFLVFTSWVFSTCNVAINDNIARPYIAAIEWDMSKVVEQQKLIWTNFIMFMISIFTCKVFLLIFYYDLIPKRCMPKLWWFNTISLAVIIMTGLGELLYQFLWCIPIKADWLRANDPKWEEKCSNALVFDIVVWALHLLTDLLVYIIPLLVINHLQILTLRKRFEAGFLFGCGFISVACAATMVITNGVLVRNLLIKTGFSNYGLWMAYNFLQPPQMSTALVVICAMQVRILVRGSPKREVAEIRPSSPGLDEEDGKMSRSEKPDGVGRGKSGHSSVTLASLERNNTNSPDFPDGV